MPRFSSTGFFARPGTLQQRKILHVARPNLDHVRVLFHQIERFVIDRFGNNLHPKLLANLGHDRRPSSPNP
jgi:hypothetical protein